MSGGSYNYLCHADSSDIGNSTEDLQKMSNRLIELGFPDVATDTQSVLNHLKEISNIIDKISEVWKSVEWMDSGDWGIEDVYIEIAEYRKANSKQHNP